MTFKTILSACAIAAMGSAASAATIDFDGSTPGVYSEYTEDGFVFDYIRIVNGNCDADSGKPCGAENDNETTNMELVGGGEFSVSSLWFQLLGHGTDNGMTLSSEKGSWNFFYPTYDTNNGGYVLDLADAAFGGIFTDILMFTIKTADGGNIRYDDIVATPSAVPLPASALLLLGGVGGLAAMRRRKKTA